MTSYLDLDDLIEELDTRKIPKSSLTENLSYNHLLHTVSEIGKMTDKAEKTFPVKGNQTNDLTADLFANMSDSEMLSHFMPVRGIDFGHGISDGKDIEKKDKKEKEYEEEILHADEFMLHRMMPQLNPLYHMSAFKSVMSNNDEVKSGVLTNNQKEQLEREISSEINFDELNEEIEDDSMVPDDELTDGKSNEPRVIKRRKPRTYKYNPKPLQHKICRSFVPDDLKDPDYWARRKRNNEAAKKSREERRKKELEILKSYEIMKQEYSQIKIENIRLKARNSMLEKQVSDLKCKLK